MTAGTKLTTTPKPKITPKPEKKRPDTGEVAPNRIPIYDHKGHMRGHVGHRATGATVARFLGRPGADLKKKDGRIAWIGHVPPPPPPPPPTIMPDGSMIPGSRSGPPNVVKGPPPPVGKPTGGREKSPDVKAAKGSVSKPPVRAK